MVYGPSIRQSVPESGRRLSCMVRAAWLDKPSVRRRTSRGGCTGTGSKTFNLVSLKRDCGFDPRPRDNSPGLAPSGTIMAECSVSQLTVPLRTRNSEEECNLYTVEVGISKFPESTHNKTWASPASKPHSSIQVAWSTHAGPPNTRRQNDKRNSYYFTR